MSHKGTFKDSLRALLASIIAPHARPTLTTEQREQLKELASVLSSIVFHGVGEIVSLRGTRLAITLLHVENGASLKYLLVVWNTGDVQLMGPKGHIDDLDFTV